MSLFLTLEYVGFFASVKCQSCLVILEVLQDFRKIMGKAVFFQLPLIPSGFSVSHFFSILYPIIY